MHYFYVTPRCKSLSNLIRVTNCNYILTDRVSVNRDFNNCFTTPTVLVSAINLEQGFCLKITVFFFCFLSFYPLYGLPYRDCLVPNALTHYLAVVQR